ncbi:MAG TPA: hypothetical protein PLP01_17400, partial [Phycisphaerae bacterium]|nr:hypothetical protein [Phycisphaerae bacterium]
GDGAKIAAATRNHAGLVYLSWKDGHGSMIHLWRDPGTGQYGLRQIKNPDGTYGHCGSVEDCIKPELVGDHGTKIILLGNAEEDDTMRAPPDTPSPSQWIAKYLNTRYFRFPSGIRIKARQGWEQPRSNTDVNVLRTLEGQEKYLEKHMDASGTVQLDGAVAHWWILKDEGALSQNSGFIESSGHMAALYKDELYDIVTARSGHARLQQFGVIFGQRQVVLYLEPISSDSRRVLTNTSRTHLLINSEPLPWTQWASEFREKMPEPISALMDRIASKSTSTDHSRSIRDRLKALLDLFKVSRYRPTPEGPLQIEDPLPKAGGTQLPLFGGPSNPGGGGAGSTGSAPKATSVGSVYSVFLKKGGVSGDDAKPDLFPTVTWVSVADQTRAQGDIEDRAARFLQDQNLLLINADFRVFVDMVRHWEERYAAKLGDTTAIATTVSESVRNWFEQALTETIIGLQAMKGSREWNAAHIDSALSEEALTSVVMQRYHPYNSIKRELGTKLGPLG